MNKKSLVALVATVVMTVGVTAGSYAWFTSSATSTDNTFKTGTLGITANYEDAKWAAQANLDNMQPGDTKEYTFTIDNNKDGKVSTLDLIYKNDITNDNFNTDLSLLIPARFTVAVTGTHVTPAAEMSFTELKTFLAQERTFTGKVAGSDTYKITITLPQATGNEYQDKTGAFKIVTNAKQANGIYK